MTWPRLMMAVGVLGLGCEDMSFREIGTDVNVIARRDDVLVTRSIKNIGKFGPKAIPQIETALHSATLRGRLNLVAALDHIGSGDAISILRHHAVYDNRPELQKACESVLQGWAVKQDDRGQSARQALVRIAEKRNAGEGPAPLADL